MRLDIFLTNCFNIQSRNKANELIKSNKVKCNGVIIAKPSFNVLDFHNIEIIEDDFYVSRASYKLKYFLNEFKRIDLKNKNALDIGSSTGGFTQVLLEKNVKKVTCVDVGTNQLHEKLKNNEKIVFFENTDIRNFKSYEIFDIVTCDVSFISILNIIDYINILATKDIIILFKPQFEVGINAKRNKKGIVKDDDAISKAQEYFLKKTNELNWNLIYSSNSKLQGKDGNAEKFFYFSK